MFFDITKRKSISVRMPNTLHGKMEGAMFESPSDEVILENMNELSRQPNPIPFKAMSMAGLDI